MITKRFFKTKDEVEVTFETRAPEGVDGVDLLCDDNGWEPLAMKSGQDGAWRLKVRFPLERTVQFRYRTSRGDWSNDDTADDYRANGFGTLNCLLDTSRPEPR